MVDEPRTLGNVLSLQDRAKSPPVISTGDVAARKAEQRRAEEADRESRRRATNWELLASQMGPRYGRATLDNWDTSSEQLYDIKKRVQSWLTKLIENTSQGRGLVLHGPRGTGKDHLAAAGLRCAVIDFGLSAAWVDGQSLFGRMRDRMTSEQTEDGAIRPLVSTDILLVSDPLPQEGKLTEYQQGVLWRIVDRRYRDLKPTWITVNVGDAKELADRMGPQLADRLRDGSLIISTVGLPSDRSAAQ